MHFLVLAYDLLNFNYRLQPEHWQQLQTILACRRSGTAWSQESMKPRSDHPRIWRIKLLSVIQAQANPTLGLGLTGRAAPLIKFWWKIYNRSAGAKSADLMPTIEQNESYTFRRYFDLRVDPIDLAQYFGYGYRKSRLALPRYQGEVAVDDLSQSIERTLPQIVSSNEQTKREMLVAPVIRRVLELTPALLRIEYPIKVSDQLQGTVDYLLSLDNLQNLIVVEAKSDDLDYGFTQMFAELIALDQWERAPTSVQQPLLLGAVTMGSLWQFGTLERTTKRLSQGLDAYQVPDDLEQLMRILLHSLKAEPT